jgi:uncharacterized membrane protein
MAQFDSAAAVQPRPSVVTVAHAVYALHAVGLVIGAFTTATVVGSFLLGWPSLIAVILNYVKRSEARGTFVESHFSWQIRTFWYSLLWVGILFAVSVPLMLVLVGFATLPIGLFVLGLWAAYRIIRGWLRLRDGEPIAIAPV